jgi:hypothetical protein
MPGRFRMVASHGRSYETWWACLDRRGIHGAGRGPLQNGPAACQSLE